MESPARAQAPGPALIRQLARISGAGAPPPPQSLSARLAQWVDWPQAVALSSALDARPGSPPGADGACAGDDGEYARLRAALVRAIENDRAFAGAAPDTATADTATTPADPALYRQRYVALRQMMEAEIGHLRGRLRQRLAKQGGTGRLAAIDAAMERALGRHERALLAPLPELLGAHFERLRHAAHDAPAGAAPPAAGASTAWLERFRHDMRDLLLAELDFRMQPAHGLHAALCTRPSGHHAP